MSGNKWYHHKYFLSGYLNEELGEKEVALVEDCGQSGRICRYVKHWSWSEKLVLRNKQNWKLLLFDACSTFTTTECGGDFGGPLLQVGFPILVLVLDLVTTFLTGRGGHFDRDSSQWLWLWWGSWRERPLHPDLGYFFLHLIFLNFILNV